MQPAERDPAERLVWTASAPADLQQLRRLELQRDGDPERLYDTFWFNSHLKVGGAKAGTTISFTGQTIQLGSYGTFKVPGRQKLRFSSTAN